MKNKQLRILKLSLYLLAVIIYMGIVFPISVIMNLENNYVYYFQHSKETNKEGIPFVLVDHLDKYTTPDFEVDGNYLYETDAKYSIVYESKKSTPEQFYWLAQNHFVAHYTVGIHDFDLDKSIYFHYDKYFQLSKIRYSETSENEVLEITDERRREVNEAIELLTKPLLERVEPPAINFQWLFDELDYWKLERKWMWQWLE